ncbi:MAG: tRNA dihydrouridine synthase DusB [Betaproteobacteria bacterium]|nr:tRNA dihydrouridine synthase DusB [Betaproteobacteria bacterium]
MRIGPYRLQNKLILAPMAGVTDRPFRTLCREFGADLAISEMVSSDARLRATPKSRRRGDHIGETAPIAVQIVGADPLMLARAARYHVDQGAQIIDINMGCPAKKVCRTLAGSALLKDERLVARLLDAVVKAVDVPVTLKTRTGWDTGHRNALTILRIAEDAGIQALALHGRTRACGYGTPAEYDTIAAVKAQARIPIIANGDITSAAVARRVLAHTGVDALMIGRAALGRPWIFRELSPALGHGDPAGAPDAAEIYRVIRRHVAALHDFYGEALGVRIARKHLAWYGRALGCEEAVRTAVNAHTDARDQWTAFDACFADVCLPPPLAA